MKYKDQCLYISTTDLSFDSAELFCRDWSDGGHLADILDEYVRK